MNCVDNQLIFYHFMKNTCQLQLLSIKALTTCHSASSMGIYASRYPPEVMLADSRERARESGVDVE